MEFHEAFHKKKVISIMQYKDIIISHYSKTNERNMNIYFAIYRMLVHLKDINRMD